MSEGPDREKGDSSQDLYGILDFRDIPEELRKLVNNYRIFVVEVKKLQDTKVFRTDIRQIFDFIRCSSDKESRQQGMEAGRIEGMETGRIAGMELGEKRFIALTQILLQKGRMEDLGRAAVQKEYRESLYEEFEL